MKGDGETPQRTVRPSLLSGPEVLCINLHAALICEQNRKLKRQPRHGEKPETAMQRTVNGCQSEYAFSKLYGLRYSLAIGDIEKPDFYLPGIGRVEIRTTHRTRSPCLRLHDGEDKNAAYILMPGINGAFAFVGWMIGADVLENRALYFGDRFKTGRPAYFVDAAATRTVEEFETLLEITGNYCHGTVAA